MHLFALLVLTFLISIVSIPCKRESTCALTHSRKQSPPASRCFHSLQTGKHMCTYLRSAKEYARPIVSIPCKRESTCARHRNDCRDRSRKQFPFPANGKAHVHECTFNLISYVEVEGFHSLQTGKHMCTAITPTDVARLRLMFPFPANGKAHVHMRGERGVLL